MFDDWGRKCLVVVFVDSLIGACVVVLLLSFHLLVKLCLFDKGCLRRYRIGWLT